MTLAAPFPYFGGKRRAAPIVWRALGDPSGYVEPFAGSAAVLLAGWMSMGGGVGAAATLFGSGVLNGNHLAIIAPALFLMGSQVQYVGRLLGVVGTRAQHIPVMIGISVLNAFGAMLVMRVLI